MIKKILIAFDGSPPAERAFQYGLDLAKAFKAETTILAVARPPEPPTMGETSAWLDAATTHFEKDFAKLRAMAEPVGVSLATEIVVGHPAEQIIHQAAEKRVDLIVMGHRGKSVMQRWLLGSVSKRVLSYATCAVLIVR